MKEMVNIFRSRTSLLYIGTMIILMSQNIEAQDPASYVNPFIGTSNFGATFPGPIAPRGMASISPFNVSGKRSVLIIMYAHSKSYQI